MKQIAAIALMNLWATISLACTCEMTPIENHIDNTDLIVTAEVVDLLDTQKEREGYVLSKPDHSYRVKIKITKVFKGAFQEGQIIELDSEYSNCDIYYKDQNEYLLFLRKEGGKYFMKHCSYSAHRINADKSIKTIKEKLKK